MLSRGNLRKSRTPLRYIPFRTAFIFGRPFPEKSVLCGATSAETFVLKLCFYNLSLLVLSSLFIVGLSEISLRAYEKLAFGIPLLDTGWAHSYLDSSATAQMSNVLDPILGWKPTPNYHYVGPRTRHASTEQLEVFQNENGFRTFGDLSSKLPRIFVVGDSYTQAIEVSNDETYHSILGRALNAEVFAIGSRGYGSLQEYMQLSAFVDRIAPQLIVWQFCYNDFMNNSYDMEYAWLAGGLGLRRPFWENGTVRYEIPRYYGRAITLTGNQLRLVFLFGTKLDRMRYAWRDSGKDKLLNEILTLKEQHPLFKLARTTTSEILALVRKRVPAVPIVLFESCTTADPFHSSIRDMAEQQNMLFVSELPGAIDVAQSRGTSTQSADGVHWNKAGHRIVAQTLQQFIDSHRILDRSVSTDSSIR